jgi:monovalent cation/hydrogen antiporter
VLITAVVATTLPVRGPSLAGIVKSSGLAIAPAHATAKEAAAWQAMDKTVVKYLNDFAAVGGVNALAVERLRARCAERLDSQTDAELLADLAALRRDVLSVQATELRRLFTEEQIGDALQRRLQDDLDRREMGLEA